VKHSEGGCLCGAVRFRVTGAPSDSLICHCRTCRKASGAPSVGWVTFDRGNLELMSGAPRRFVSSPGVERTFCGDCGSALTYASAETPSSIDITTISLDDESAFPPTGEVWVSHKVAWEPTDPKLVQYPRSTSEE
jgi:hypothetical protein